LNSNFVLFRASRGEKTGDETFKRFNVRATPTIMAIGSDGSEVDWHVGYSPPADNFLEKLEQTLKGIDTFKSLSEKYSKEPKNVEVVFKLAQKYDRRYNQEKALELYQQVLAIDPEGKMGTTDYDEEKVTYTEYAEFSIGTMKVYSRKSDPEPIKAFIKKYPESKMLKSAYGRLSYYYRARGSKEETAAFYEDYTSRWPEDPNVLSSYVSRIIRDKDNFDKGIELAEKIKDVMKYNPEPSYMKSLAELHILKEDKDKAEEVYGETFMDKQVSNLFYNLIDYANFWVGKDANVESAEEMIDLALKLKPDSGYGVRTAASIYIKLDKLDKALAVFGPEIVKEYMDQPSDLSRYARFWANQGENLESALEAAKKSVELYPSDSTWATVSRVYTKLKKYSEALEAAEKAVEMADEGVKITYENKIKLIKKAQEEEKKEKK
jgi:tetratricopeptide (TPR) repeat protein